jgi:hypothetical protein
VVKLDRRLYTYWITPNSATNHAYRVSKADEVDAAYRAMLVMQGTGNTLVSEIGAQHYADILLAHWYRCYRLGSEGVQKAKELRKKMLNTYATIKKYLSRKQVWKCALLLKLPPFSYCVCRLLSERKLND